MTADLSPTYPLTRGQVEEITAFHEADTSELEGRLLFLSDECQKNCTAGFAKCNTHQKEMRKAYQNAYTTVLPGRWISYRPADYVNDLNRMFDAQASMKKINDRVHREKLQHIKDSQCTVAISDHPTVKKAKAAVLALYDEEKSQAEINSYIREQEEKLRSQLTPEQQEVQIEFDKSKSEAAKYSYMRACACTPKPTDTPKDIDLRLKWARLFDTKLPYHEIVTVMEKDIADAKANMQLLENRLADLQNAQAANNKAKAAKEEEKAKQAREAVRHCCSEGCGNICELSGPNADLGCEKCYEMKEKGELQSYSWFCSPECAQAHAGSHNAKFHPSA